MSVNSALDEIIQELRIKTAFRVCKNVRYVDPEDGSSVVVIRTNQDFGTIQHRRRNIIVQALVYTASTENQDNSADLNSDAADLVHALFQNMTVEGPMGDVLGCRVVSHTQNEAEGHPDWTVTVIESEVTT